MVATRRGTRVDPQEEGESAAAEPTPMEVSSPNSRMHTRSSVRKDGQTIESSAGEGKGSPLKSDSETHNKQMSTRSRSRNEQLDTESWEVKSTSSTTSHSKQSLGQLTDSTRKLRNRRSAMITEPSESKDDAELSEAESHCSSVSTTARRRQPQTTSSSVSTRGRKSVLPSEPISDVSEAESNSSTSGVKIIATRSTRSSRARHPSSLVSEPQKEPTSDAESCSSGFSLRPLAGRSRRRNPSNSQLGEVFVSENNKDDAQDQETLKKQSSKIQRVKTDIVLSSPRRRLRNPLAIQEDEVLNISDHDDEPESSDAVPDMLAVEQPELEQSSAIEEDESPVKGSPMSSLQSSETRPEKPEQLLKLSIEPMDEEPAKEKHPVSIDKDPTREANEALQKGTQMADGVNIHLVIDSDDGEKSEGSDDDDDDLEDDQNMEEEEEDEVVEKLKSKKSSTSQLQNVPGDGLFVIDTAPGLDSSKQYFLEPEDDEEQVVKKQKSKKQSKSVEGDGLFVIDTAPGVDSTKKYFLEPEDHDKKDKSEASEKWVVPEPEDEEDDDDDDFIDEDEAVDEEENLLNSTRSSCVLSSTIDTGINLKKMGGLYINFDAAKPNPGPSLLSKMKGIKKKDELLQKSVITPDFEKKESVPPYSQSKHKLKQLRKVERDRTTGKGWFDMKAPDMTPELKNDLKALQMRSAMDPKHFYKKNDREGFPKYFQVATVVDNPADFYHSRVPKKQRKRTIVEELLADSEFRRYNKKKYMEIVSEKAARAAGKKNRKKKKFRK